MRLWLLFETLEIDGKYKMSFIHVDFDIFGVDVSVWQQLVNWDKAIESGSSFGIARSSNGLDTDRQFYSNWSRMKMTHLPRGSYHFFKYDKPSNGQANTIIMTLGADPGELPIFIDCEADGPGGKFSTVPLPPFSDYPGRVRFADKYCSYLNQLLSILDSRFGRKKIGIYSAAGFWNSYVAISALCPSLLGRYTWVANYLFGQPPFWRGARPILPTGWTGWDFWQLSADNPPNNLGYKFGVVTSCVDVNVWHGDKDHLLREFNITEPKPGQPIFDPHSGVPMGFER